MAEPYWPEDRSEVELEMLRRQLHEAVGHDPARLSDDSVLPLSRRLDALILEVQKRKMRTSSTMSGPRSVGD
ncbi:Spo0E family sporulation regulatory protein-aspartic acid phosphatase [Staphylospora marina]|uniref:Spo0E family sporulation regulatory protein-aspartic acid phosphatase n=1 Tax=Staphylospora marina TaxID=2490858 RepID=UPI000F5BAFAC|nr:Spo0E family sporulation regulatory protein-aspartic acid phosphatase [Staphylospora marina]